jgi:hypothetical protein
MGTDKNYIGNLRAVKPAMQISSQFYNTITLTTASKTTKTSIEGYEWVPSSHQEKTKLATDRAVTRQHMLIRDKCL